MTPERWQKIERIFQAALAEETAGAGVREAFLEKACGADEELRREVVRLLALDKRAGDFIETPVADNAAHLLSQTHDAETGERIGNYKILREIGRGGMGAVYLAERADGEFRQKVAVKIVKRGMDTDFILRRFRQERQVLAALEHPFIARLLDGGATEDGRPFLVMEYVEGIAIDRYCDERKLSIHERLRLFRDVCAAVAYSHQRLVIHRDIKPSNIIVTKDGTPKLLDFGIAKLLDASGLLSDSFEPTATAARMMTPEYASPEQLRGETVTTVSDVYSLGVLLYLLLTGHRPFRFNTREPQNFARLVSERDPQRPSAVITRSEKTTVKNSDQGTTEATPIEVARNRATQPERLRRYLAEDLDNVVMKALRKEAERRYSSVEQFSEDIRRHLEGLPVNARGDDFAYKTRKFVGRHKTALTVAVLLVLTLIGGITATGWQAGIARRERARAQSEAERAQHRFEEQRRLTGTLMFELHDAIQNLQGATAARELLAKRTLEHLDSLALEARDDPSLQSELVIAYINLGDVQGNPFYPNLGDTAGGLESYRKAEQLAEALTAANPGDDRLRRRFWRTQMKIGDILTASGDLRGAAERYARSRSIIEELSAKHPDDAELRRDLASSYDRHGNILLELNESGAALGAFRHSLAIFQELSAAANPPDDSLERSVAAGYGKVGYAQLQMKDSDAALASYRKLIEINERRFAANPSNAVTKDDLGGSLRVLGDAQVAVGDYRAAAESYRRQLQIYQELAAADSANARTKIELSVSYNRVGSFLLEIGDSRGALDNHQKALDILRQATAEPAKNAPARDYLPSTYFFLGTATQQLAAGAGSKERVKLGREACSWFQQSLQALIAAPQNQRLLLKGIRQPTADELNERIARCGDAALPKL